MTKMLCDELDVRIRSKSEHVSVGVGAESSKPDDVVEPREQRCCLGEREIGFA